MSVPEVRTSIPQSKNSSAIFGVIPNPAAAFSQFRIVRSAWYSCWRDSRYWRTIARPAFPTVSPMKSIFMKIFASPWTARTLPKDGHCGPAGYRWGPREACGAHLFEPVYTGGHPIHALGDLGTPRGKAHTRRSQSDSLTNKRWFKFS